MPFMRGADIPLIGLVDASDEAALLAVLAHIATDTLSTLRTPPPIETTWG